MSAEDTKEMVICCMLDERRAHEDPWLGFVSGTLTTEQLEAMYSDPNLREELEDRLEKFRPSSKEASERALSMLLDRYWPSSSGSAPPESSSGSGSGSIAKEETSVDDVVSPQEISPRRDSRPWSSICGVIALAAAILITWSMQRPGAPNELEMLPEFEFEFDGGRPTKMRGVGTVDEPKSLRCKKHRQRIPSFSVRLRPEEPLRHGLAVAAFAQPEFGEGRWLEFSPEQSDNGILSVSDLGLSSGVWTLTFYVTRKGQTIESSKLRRFAPGTHPGVSVVESLVCVVGEGELDQ